MKKGMKCPVPWCVLSTTTVPGSVPRLVGVYGNVNEACEAAKRRAEDWPAETITVMQAAKSVRFDVVIEEVDPNTSKDTCGFWWRPVGVGEVILKGDQWFDGYRWNETREAGRQVHAHDHKYRRLVGATT